MLINFKIKDLRKYFPIFVVIVISMFALSLRLKKLAGHNFWADELAQLETIDCTSFLEVIKNVQIYEFCSLLSGDYYLIYPFFKIFSYNKWGLAIPHIIATILGFYLLYLICKLYFKTIWSYIITFTIVCFNATLIEHATEIRTYAVLPTLALAVFYLSQLLVECPDISTRKRWLIGAFFVLVIWFHVYGILILLLPLIFSLLSKLHDKNFKSILRNNIKLLSIVFLIAMPLWFCGVFGPHQGYRSDTAYRMFEYIPNPVVDIVGFLKGIFGNLMGYKKLYPLLMGITFPFIFPYKDKYKQIAFLSIMILLPIVLILLSDLMIKYWFIQRQFIWVMPFFAFYIGWTWESLFMYTYGKFNGE